MVVGIAVGAALGFLSGLGVGGGSLLMLWLTLVSGLEQSQARLINLMFFIPCALISTLFRWKEGKANWPLTLTAIAAGLLGAWLGAFLQGRFDEALLKKALGVLFLFCGLRELCYRPKC